jgi:hypothetical protein
MLLSRRSYDRHPPSREAKKIFIICEGTRREPQYFSFFKELDSRVDIILHPLSDQDDNSPRGLGRIAKDTLLSKEAGVSPKIELLIEDEVWIVFDTDPDKLNSRSQQISDLRKDCVTYGWYAAQSNPCFEVWLLFHFFEHLHALADQQQSCQSLKTHLGEAILGGFDCRKHPLRIDQAIIHAGNAFEDQSGQPNSGSTEVFRLGSSIFDLVKDKLQA